MAKRQTRPAAEHNAAPSAPSAATAEHLRLQEDRTRTKNWKRWGPYLSERQWGTVREDYSPDGSCWDYFPHEHARSRTYRWGEDGLLGWTDRECRLCFAIALWNGKDPILKERLFGLTGPQGNHGEDVKECYYYLDSTPTHSYARALYKYPHAEFPYARLQEESQRRDRLLPEFELSDTGVLTGRRYNDVFIEFAKSSPDDLLIRITAANRGPEPVDLHVLPTLWFRNTWSWGCTHEGCEIKPRIALSNAHAVLASHSTLGHFALHASDRPGGSGPEWWFTENESNFERLFGSQNLSPFTKDAFHDALIHGRRDALNPRQVGTKAAAYYPLRIAAGGECVIELRLRESAPLARKSVNSASAAASTAATPSDEDPWREDFAAVFALRKREADEYYAAILPKQVAAESANVMRQGYAGLLWSKQFYHYAVAPWLDGDPDQPPPPAQRKTGRNRDWQHLFNRDLISMPDKWEYPWYAAWDLAFHMIPFAHLDPDFAKEQIVLFLREWYMHPNGQIPAYEFALGDVNPPVHAWAAWRVYKRTGPKGHRDRVFLERVFHKLLLNFTWWVNRKDPDGRNLFSGGFLGLDNIGVFDRSRPLPTGGHLEQADGTAWMAFYCTTMLAIAIELASEDPVYEDVASKFFEHFIAIADAINTLGGTGLWNEEDGFYYDQLHLAHEHVPLKIRSMVGLVPLFAVEVLDPEVIDKLPGFAKRMNWFLQHKPELARHITCMESGGRGRLLAIPSRDRLERLLKYLLDENEFLSPYGIRALSRVHQAQPYVFDAGGEQYRVSYVPGESDTALFGGNSNWRGPIWFPVNYLIVEALQRYHYFYGDSLKVEYPTGSGKLLNLTEIATQLSRRLARIFLPDAQGTRPVHGEDALYREDPHFKDLVLFYEYFHGDTGRGLGASHQTGWTALIVKLLEQLG